MAYDTIICLGALAIGMIIIGCVIISTFKERCDDLEKDINVLRKEIYNPYIGEFLWISDGSYFVICDSYDSGYTSDGTITTTTGTASSHTDQRIEYGNGKQYSWVKFRQTDVKDKVGTQLKINGKWVDEKYVIRYGDEYAQLRKEKQADAGYNRYKRNKKQSKKRVKKIKS